MHGGQKGGIRHLSPVFKPGNLSFGFVLPLTRPGETSPDPFRV